MAYDQDLADRLRLLLGEERLAEKAMFGGLAFLAGGHLAFAVSGQSGLMVRTDPTRTEALLREPGAQVMEMRGQVMKGWLRVAAVALDDDEVLRAWAAGGIAYARSLPPK